MDTRMINFIILHILALYAAFQFQGCSSDANLATIASKSPFGSSSSNAVGSSASVFLQVTGNVYPTGHYYVTMYIGNPPKPYFLDIDTGSDLTWVQCDLHCANCLPAPHPPYKPTRDELIICKDPACVALHWPNPPVCESPGVCDFEIEYADQGTSNGVLVKDSFPLRYTNGTVTTPGVVFGCGFNQAAPNGAPYLDGILGLGKHYSLGTAELFFGEKTSGMNGLTILFDSGSTYTYFKEEAYQLIVSLLTNDIRGKQLNNAVEDNTLPICWKGPKPFKSIQDVRNLFKPIVLSFANPKNVRFQIDPEGYLIITEQGNACLGILNGTEGGTGDFNVIGDISFQNKLIIYDNVRKQIGWAPANCNRIPRS